MQKQCGQTIWSAVGKLWATILFLAALFGLARPGFSQSSKDLDLAKEYLRREEFAKANTYFQKMYKDEKLALTIYPLYLQSLKGAKDFEEAERISKKAYKTTRNPVFLGQAALAAKEGADLKSYNRQAEDAISAVKNPALGLGLYQFFMQNNLAPEAEKTIIRLRKLTGRTEDFAMEMAAAYKAQGKKEQMIEQMLTRAARDPMAMVEVQGILQQQLEDKEEIALFERKLLEQVQLQPDAAYLADLLYWLYIQQKDFAGAFIQAKAIDRRAGARQGAYPSTLMEVATLARQNNDFYQAEEVLDYIIKQYQGQDAGYQALRMLVKLQDDRLRNTYPLDKQQVESVLESYRRLLSVERNFQGKNEARRDMAAVVGFLQERYDTAILMLDDLLKNYRPSPELTARAKLDMGDLYLLNGEPWESTLLYSQVEKDNKDQPLGHEAKLRNARLSFYKGEFTLAKEHLDVLKMATSREIANDAMQLSLTIQDNMVYDTLGQGLAYLGRAELNLMKNKYDKALSTLDSIASLFAGHTLADDVLWKKAQIYLKTKRITEGRTALEAILSAHKEDIYGDDALFTLAELEEKQMNKPRAMELYEQVLKDFPGSIYSAESRKRFRALRGDGV